MFRRLILDLHRSTRVPATIAACLATLLACNDDYEPPPSAQGELGRGEFTYRCSGQSDALCPGSSQTATGFPKAVAQGGRFSLDYAYNEDYAGMALPLLKTSAPARIADANGIFTGIALGYTSIIGVSGTSEVIDVKHMRLAAIDHLEVTEDFLTIGETVTVSAGAELALTVSPYGAQDELLAGSLDYTWTTADPTIAAVVGAGTDDLASIEGLSEGETTVTVQVGELALQIAVVVLPGTTSDSDGTTTGTTTGSTGDTDDSSTTDDSGTTDDSSTTDDSGSTGSTGSTGG